MKYYLLLGIGLLIGFSGCSKKEDATPANTLQMTVKGKQINFPISGITAVFNQSYKEFVLTANAGDANKNSLQINASAGNFSQPRVYNAGAFLSSVYEYFILNDFKNACGQTVYKNYSITYRTGATATPVFTFTIEAIDTDKHVFSGTFSGDYWQGCDKVEVTSGQFNLPYTLKP